MAELPDDGDRGELWRVPVPVVFKIAARSWIQAREIVDRALISRSVGALSAAGGGHDASEAVRIGETHIRV